MRQYARDRQAYRRSTREPQGEVRVVGVTPSYRRLWEKGELSARAAEAKRRLEACDLCAHECGVNRLAGAKGFCRAGDMIEISSYGPHFGEEDVLVGSWGSGTIFLTGCNLKCVFCQNYDISHLRDGYEVSPGKFAEIMRHARDCATRPRRRCTPAPTLHAYARRTCLRARYLRHWRESYLAGSSLRIASR